MPTNNSFGIGIVMVTFQAKMAKPIYIIHSSKHTNLYTKGNTLLFYVNSVTEKVKVKNI